MVYQVCWWLRGILTFKNTLSNSSGAEETLKKYSDFFIHSVPNDNQDLFSYW